MKLKPTTPLWLGCLFLVGLGVQSTFWPMSSADAQASGLRIVVHKPDHSFDVQIPGETMTALAQLVTREILLALPDDMSPFDCPPVDCPVDPVKVQALLDAIDALSNAAKSNTILADVMAARAALLEVQP